METRQGCRTMDSRKCKAAPVNNGRHYGFRSPASSTAPGRLLDRNLQQFLITRIFAIQIHRGGTQLVHSHEIPYSSRVKFFLNAAMVQRLARSPFKAKIRVRFPLAVPNFSVFLRATRKIAFG